MKKIAKIFLLISLFSIKTIAQTGLWLKFGAEKKITKKLEIEVNLQPRFNDVNEKPSSWLGELGLKYDIVKNLNIAVFYRHIKNEKKDVYKPYHRFYGDLSYKFKKLNPIVLDYRLRYQQQFADDDSGLITDKNYWRNKLEIAYKNKSKFEPYLSTDLFYKEGYAFDQIRYKAGLEFKITKNQSIDASYLIDDALNSKDESKSRVAVAHKFKF